MSLLYIFDLDGTIALIGHRRHLVEGEKKDWRAFFKACVDDIPNGPVIETMTRLHESGATIWIWSGRSDEALQETRDWLARNVPNSMSYSLKMRKAGDHRPDDVLKSLWLEGMTLEDRARLVAIFDDRDRVVEMWRSHGVACFQVARGNF